MLSAKNVSATIAVKNLDAARKFYEDKLGFKQQETDDENYIGYKSGGSDLLVYKSEFAGGYKATVATWQVGSELENIVNTLKKSGVQFEHYQMPDTRLDGDIHVSGKMKMAWCKDPDGNILDFVSG